MSNVLNYIIAYILLHALLLLGCISIAIGWKWFTSGKSFSDYANGLILGVTGVAWCTGIFKLGAIPLIRATFKW